MKSILALFRRPGRPAELRIGARNQAGQRRLPRPRLSFDSRPGLAIEMSGEKGIALLPFADLAPRPDHPYLADGFTRDLAQVISLNPSFFAEVIVPPYRESEVEGPPVRIVHNLLLEGAIARRSRQLNVSVRVVECSTGDILWSDRFTAPLEHAAALQDDIAEAIAGAVTSTPYFLRVETRPSGTACRGAWALRQAGRALLHDGPDPIALEDASRLLSLASRLDPAYGDGRIGLAETLSMRPLLLASPDPSADRARRDEVLASAEAVAPSHNELPFIRGLRELDAGRPEKAAACLRRSIRVAAIMIPARIFLSLAEARSGKGRAARADAVIAFKRAGRPGWTALAEYAKAEAALARGDRGQAAAALEAAMQAAAGSAEIPPPVVLLHSLLLSEAGDQEAARAVLGRHWPASLARPDRRQIAAWLEALPGMAGESGPWLEEVVSGFSHGN